MPQPQSYSYKVLTRKTNRMDTKTKVEYFIYHLCFPPLAILLNLLIHTRQMLLSLYAHLSASTYLPVRNIYISVDNNHTLMLYQHNIFSPEHLYLFQRFTNLSTPSQVLLSKYFLFHHFPAALNSTYEFINTNNSITSILLFINTD